MGSIAPGLPTPVRVQSQLNAAGRMGHQAEICGYTFLIAATISAVSRSVYLGSSEGPAKRLRISSVRGQQAAPYWMARPRSLVNDGQAGSTVRLRSMYG